jgi:ribosomal RNA-processing protein 8
MCLSAIPLLTPSYYYYTYAAATTGLSLPISLCKVNPLDNMIAWLKREPSQSVVADLGCGEAVLAASVPQQVHSFDLVAQNSTVVACDIAHVPLPDKSVDLVVFCLALMGTNYPEFLTEAHRLLRTNGKVKIAEITSRLKDIPAFVALVEALGFVASKPDQSNPFFIMLEFKKVGAKSGPLPDSTAAGKALGPCIYKRR